MVDLEQMANGIGLEVWSTIIAFQSAAMVPQSAGR
jgi:hypothetical protein